MKTIYEVNAVSVKLLKTHPARWQVSATGTVTSSGWTKPRLIPHVYVHPPQDGFMEFDFVAEPPTGIHLPVLQPVAAQAVTPVPGWARGVRVIAQTNAVSATPTMPAAKATMVAQPFAAHEAARPVDLQLQMALDADVSFYDAVVLLENLPVAGWKWDADKSAYTRSCPGFPVNGRLDVLAAARSRNQPAVPRALVLTIGAPGGVAHTLTVATTNFKGRATASYDV